MEDLSQYPGGGRFERALRRFAVGGASVLAAYHRAQLSGAERLQEGPALLVGNHGVYGYDTPIFFLLLLRETGRFPVGLADRGFFKLPGFKQLLPMVGGIEGTRARAIEALGAGHLVVCYPGGAREVFKRSTARHMLRWSHTYGFARVAAQAQVRVLPFACVGADHAFAFTSEWRLPLSRSSRRYAVPVGVPLPLPVQLRFQIGRPLDPPPVGAGEETLREFRDLVARRVRRLLVRASHA